MPRQFYTDDERFNIFTGTVGARRDGKSWVETHAVAKGAGFKGGVPALMIFIKNQRKKNKKVVRAVEKKVKASLKAVKESMDPARQIVSSIDRLVQDRVRVAIEKAIEVLKSAL